MRTLQAITGVVRVQIVQGERRRMSARVVCAADAEWQVEEGRERWKTLLFSGGLIFDGGNPPASARDVLIENGRIAAAAGELSIEKVREFSLSVC